MRRGIVPMTLLMLAVGSVQAKVGDRFMDGLSLLMMCKNDILHGQCLGYIEGALDSSDLMISCTPDNLKAGQAELIVTTYLAAHPEVLHEAAWVLVQNAMIDAFRCSRK
jgi:hypothetical protein